jgi:flagellar biogenesis protein FliO
MLSQALAVLFVLALLGAALWLSRRPGVGRLTQRLTAAATGRSERQMRVVERLPLSGRHCLHLVELGGRRIVIAVSPDGCYTLAEFSDPLNGKCSARSSAH